MRSIPLFLFLASVCAVSTAADSLDVRVVDPQGAVVPRATVHVIRRDAQWRSSARADDEGALRFDALTNGTYLIYAEAPGFVRSRTQTVALTEKGEASIELALDLAAYEESVVVTSTSTAQGPSEIGKSTSVVGTEEITVRDEHYIPEALRTVPGLRVQQVGGPGSFTTIRTRGLRGEDTAILVDGARFRDAAAPQGDASGFLEALMVTDVDGIEILRGAGSTLYGTNAGGGTINIVTAPGGGNEARGSLLAEGGGLGLFRGHAQLAGGANDRFLYSVGASHLNVADGVDGNDEARNTSLQGRAQVKVGATSSLSFRFYGADARLNLNESPEAIGTLPDGVIDAIPGETFRPSFDDPDSERESSFTSTLVSFEQRPRADFGYTLRYHGLLTDRTFFDGPSGDTAFEPVVSSLSEFGGGIHTLNARADFAWGSHQLLDAGYEYERESFTNRSFPDDPSANASTEVAQTSHALYLQDQLRFLDGALSIVGAVRGQFWSLEEPTFDPEENAPYQGTTFPSPDNAVTGDISGAYAFAGGTKLRAHFGTGYRAPSLFERFGTSFSSFGYGVFGDPRLSPERTRTFDVGIDQDFASKRGRFGATYFRTRLEEIIIFDFSGAIDPATDPFGRFGGYLSADGGTTQGVELTGTVVPIPGLHIYGSYTFTDAEPPTGVTEDQTQAFIVPRNQFALVATQRFGQNVVVSFDLIATGSYLAPIFDPATFASRVYRFDGYVKSDLVASYRLGAGFRVFGKVENLFDQQIYESGFRTPGRYALVGAGFEF